MSCVFGAGGGVADFSRGAGGPGFSGGAASFFSAGVGAPWDRPSSEKRPSESRSATPFFRSGVRGGGQTGAAAAASDRGGGQGLGFPKPEPPKARRSSPPEPRRSGGSLHAQQRPGPTTGPS